MFAAIADAALWAVRFWWVQKGKVEGTENLQHKIGVNEVIERLEEDREETEACQETGKGGHDPVDAGFVAGPPKPEQPACEGYTTHDDRGKTPFRDGHVVVRRQFSIVGWLREHNVQPGQEHSDNHAKIR